MLTCCDDLLEQLRLHMYTQHAEHHTVFYFCNKQVFCKSILYKNVHIAILTEHSSIV